MIVNFGVSNITAHRLPIQLSTYQFKRTHTGTHTHAKKLFLPFSEVKLCCFFFFLILPFCEISSLCLETILFFFHMSFIAKFYWSLYSITRPFKLQIKLVFCYKSDFEWNMFFFRCTIFISCHFIWYLQDNIQYVSSYSSNIYLMFIWWIDDLLRETKKLRFLTL